MTGWVRTAVVCATLAMISCTHEPKTLRQFDKLEREAASLGHISAGAVRVYPYNAPELEAAREILIKLIENLLQGAGADPSAELAQLSLATRDALFALRVFDYEGQIKNDGQEEGSNSPTGIKQAVDDALAKLNQLSGDVQPNPLDAYRFRLDTVRYLLSRLEDAMLRDKPRDEGFRRVVVDVQLTAMVRPEKAAAAVVYFDLYPSNGDGWAHEAGVWLENIQLRFFTMAASRSDEWKCNDCKLQFEPFSIVDERRRHEEWREYVNAHFADRDYCCQTALSAKWTTFVSPGESESPNSDELQTLKKDLCHGWEKLEKAFEKSYGKRPSDASFLQAFPINDFVAHGHRQLSRQAALPRLVHVEVLGEGEMLEESDAIARSFRASVSGGTSKIGATLAGGSTNSDVQRGARIHRLSLAFAAGDRRAGWYFFPSGRDQLTGMKPTERRIQMVVDVPKGMKSLDVFVHKNFLDRSMRPLPAASSTAQIRAQNLARRILSDIETKYPPPAGQFLDPDDIDATTFQTTTNWSILKSRLRNNLDHYWSEKLSVSIPVELDQSKDDLAARVQEIRKARLDRLFKFELRSSETPKPKAMDESKPASSGQQKPSTPPVGEKK